jgi:peptidyl-prolyl cis-trans isomerase D
MLDFMRRQRSALKWVWVILIFIFSVTLVTLYIPFGDLPTVSITNDVASVGDDTISAREFQAAYRNYIDRMRGQLTPEMLRAFKFERQIMDALVTRHVMTEHARRLGLNASVADIEQKILENPAFREAGNFIGRARYQAILAQNNLTIEEFELAVRDDIMTDKLRSFVTAGVSVSDKEVETEYKRRNEKAKLEYFVIDPAKLADKVTPTDPDKRDYYEKNKAKYNVPEKRQAKYIFVETLKMRAQVTVSDDELRQYYAQHQTEYQLPDRVTAQHILFKTQEKKPEEVAAIRQKAREVLERAKKGEDFGSLAKQFSEDTSAANGGELGSFTRGQMVPEFEQVAFSLAPGAVSDLVQTQFGIHIIKVKEKQEARTRPFEELKEAVRPIVSTRKAEQKVSDLAQQIAVELVTNKDLNAVAQKFGVEVKETPLVEPGQQIPELGNAAELERRMVLMAKGEIGTAIQTERGYVVPMLTEIAPAHPASFEEAQTRVTADVKTEQAQRSATEKGNQVQELIKSGKDLATAAKAVGAEIKTSELLTRGASVPDFGSIAEFDKEIFSLPIGKPGTPSTIAGKTFAFSVKERQEIKPEEMKKSIETLRAEVSPGKREQYFSAYIQEVRKKMETNKEIRINESVLTQIAQTIA